MNARRALTEPLPLTLECDVGGDVAVDGAHWRVQAQRLPEAGLDVHLHLCVCMCMCGVGGWVAGWQGMSETQWQLCSTQSAGLGVHLHGRGLLMARVGGWEGGVVLGGTIEASAYMCSHVPHMHSVHVWGGGRGTNRGGRGGGQGVSKTL